MNSIHGLRSDRKTVVLSKSHYEPTAIDPTFINAFINPELYKARRPSQTFETSLIYSTVAIPIFTNASGNGAMFVLPQNMMNDLAGEFLTQTGAPVVS